MWVMGVVCVYMFLDLFALKAHLLMRWCSQLRNMSLTQQYQYRGT